MEVNLPWYVYLIHCSDNTLYCDVARNAKVVKKFRYLQTRTPYKIVKKRMFNRLSDAVVKCLEVRKLRKQDKTKGLER